MLRLTLPFVLGQQLDTLMLQKTSTEGLKEYTATGGVTWPKIQKSGHQMTWNAVMSANNAAWCNMVQDSNLSYLH